MSNQAWTYFLLGNTQKAVELTQKSLDITESIVGSQHPDFVNNLGMQALYYNAQGDTSRAIELRKRGLEIGDRNLNIILGIGSERQKQNYMALLVESGDFAISSHLQSAPNNPQAANLALTTILRRKGRILDVLSDSRNWLRQNLTPENQKLFDELSSTNSQFAKLLYNKNSNFTSAQYRQEVAQLKTKAENLEAELSKRSAEFRITTQPVTIEAVQKLIPADTALVEFVQYKPLTNIKGVKRSDRYGKPRYAAYILTSQGSTQWVDLGEAEAIDKEIAEFGDILQSKSRDVKPVARRLDTQLMQPIRKLLGDKRKLLISPDSQLNLIPFAALVDENNRYLVENYTINYLTTGRDLLRLSNQPSSVQPPQSLEGFNEKAVFTVVDANGQGRGQVQISSRQGLTAKGKLVNTPRTQLQKGTLLQERIRTIPKDLTLKIGLDDTSLDSNTIKQAKQALQAINRIEALSLEQSEVHYIFGRMTQAKYQELQQKRISNLPAVGSFGLFSPTLDGIISSSFGNANEAVSSAVERLRPKLKSFLAARIVKDILGNTNTSKISITASMVVAGSQKLLAETFTTRSIKQNTGVVNSPKPTKPINFSNSGIAKLPVGISIAFHIQNNESVPLHVSILGIDSIGKMDVLFPYDRSEGATIIQPRQKLLIPQPPEPGEKPTTFDISEPLGFGEALIIASTEPLRGFIDIIKTLANTRGISDQRSPIPDITGDEFLDLTNSLLDDLDRSTRGGTGNENTQLPPDTRGSDATKLAVMSIPFEVVA